ncbi:LuxR C-terminal-related transcriptional regulator [Clostridioides difficile]|uniref:LuxR C-terminal-related transcriptional regulator n=2 Tax=Clostridioides TaxID=1870884 RepID=UPI002FD2B3B5
MRRQENRRNENGLTKKQQELLDLKNELLKLKEKGLSNRSIAKQLNISESKVRTTLKK